MGPLSFDCLDSTSNMVFAKALVSDAVQLVHLKSIKGYLGGVSNAWINGSCGLDDYTYSCSVVDAIRLFLLMG